MDCIEHTTAPELPNDFCNGKRYDTRCVYSETAFTLLGIPANSSLDEILNAMVLALNANNTRLNAQDVIIASLEERIDAQDIIIADLTERVELLEA